MAHVSLGSARIHCCVFVACAIAAVPQIALGAERWIAVSTTAASITGDVRFTPRSLLFSNGRRISLRYMKDVSGNVSYLHDARSDATARLYRVTPPADPQLLSSNRFCGSKATFVTIRRDATHAGADVFLSVYSGAAAPLGKTTDALCAGYTYGLADSGHRR